jgi:hypothetical protein
LCPSYKKNERTEERKIKNRDEEKEKKKKEKNALCHNLVISVISAGKRAS